MYTSKVCVDAVLLVNSGFSTHTEAGDTVTRHLITFFCLCHDRSRHFKESAMIVNFPHYFLK
jgi:hypothetical protein